MNISFFLKWGRNHFILSLREDCFRNLIILYHMEKGLIILHQWSENEKVFLTLLSWNYLSLYEVINWILTVDQYIDIQEGVKGMLTPLKLWNPTQKNNPKILVLLSPKKSFDVLGSIYQTELLSENKSFHKYRFKQLVLILLKL